MQNGSLQTAKSSFLTSQQEASLAQDGAAVIMISSEMEEIINMCDRAVVMRQGIVTGELDKKELNEQGLIALAMGVA